MVRGWVSNQPTILDGDTTLLEAIAAGQCDVGITNSYYLARLVSEKPGFPVAPSWANQGTGGTHVNVSGAGVTAHAKNRDQAVRLLEFLTSPEAQATLAAASFEYPVNPDEKPHPILETWGSFEQETVGVAATGKNQAEAVKLADRADYR